MSADHNQSNPHNGSLAEGKSIDSCPVCGLRVDSSITVCPRDGSVIGDFSSTEKLLDNRYQVLSLIATGGMGSIYKAKQPALNKVVAIKMLKVQNRGDGAWARFQQEAKAASQLEHPNIIRVYDFGETADGQPFMVMDFVEGSNLQSLLKEEKTLPIEEGLNIFRQICAGMTHAHSKKVFHRDLKPGNIMLSGLEGTNPQVRIVDFGIAKVMDGTEDLQALTQTGEVFGSPLYMSPEQALGKKVDGRSDIYSLGCIMYETLSGTVPLVGATPFETLMKHMNDKPLNLRQAKRDGKFSDELVALVSKTLAKDPSKRFQSMEELQDALDTVPEALAQSKQRALIAAAKNTGAHRKIHPAQAKPKLEKTEPEKETSKRPLILGLAITVVIGLAALAYLAVSGSINKQSQNSVLPAPVELNKQQAVEMQNSRDDLSKIDSYKTNKESDPEGISPIYLDGASYTDRELAQEVSKNPNTKSVTLDRAERITDEGIQILENLPLVEELTLRRVKISDKGLKVVSSLPKLRKLCLTSLSGITDTGLAYLRPLTQLEGLDLSLNADISDKGLSNLPKSLEILSLKGDPISTVGCTKIGELTQLTTLDLSNTMVDDTDLKHLEKLPKLKFLGLAGTSISDKGMKSLIKINSLEQLILARSHVTNRGLFDLQHLPHIHLINIDQCPYTRFRQIDTLTNSSNQTIVLQ
jgi:serine/threonine protein kinase